MKAIHIPLLINLLIPAWALAVDVEASLTPDCSNPISTNEITLCRSMERDTVEQEMNLEYKRVMASLPNKLKAKLRTEQEEWLKRRESECEEETADGKGGREWSIYFENCLKDSTETRIGEIANWAASQKASEPNKSFKADALRARP